MGPFLLGAGAMFAAMYSTQPILPDLARAFAVSPSAAGLSVSAVIGALAVGAWFWGPLSDRIGRRASLVLASALIVPPTLAAALAPSLEVLLVARTLQGLCMPGLLTVGVPYVTEAYATRLGRRAMGYYVTSLIVGGLVGRVGVALTTAVTGWRVALAAVAVLPLTATLVMRRSLPEEPVAPARTAGHRLRRVSQLARNATLVTATIGGSALFFAFMAVFSYVDFQLRAPPFSLPPAAAGLVFVLWGVGAVGPVASRLADRVGWQPVTLAGLATCAAGAALCLAPGLALFLLGLACVTLGNFAGVTGAQIGVSESTELDRGLASALYFSAYYLAGSLGCYLPGWAWQAWRWDGVVGVALGAYAIGFVAVAAIGARGVCRRRQR